MWWGWGLGAGWVGAGGGTPAALGHPSRSTAPLLRPQPQPGLTPPWSPHPANQPTRQGNPPMKRRPRPSLPQSRRSSGWACGRSCCPATPPPLPPPWPLPWGFPWSRSLPGSSQLARRRWSASSRCGGGGTPGWVGVAPLGGWVCVAALWVGRWVDHACVGEWVGVALGAGGAPLHPWKAPSASRLLCCIALGWWWQGGMFWTITLDQAGSLVPAGPCRQI